MWNPLKVCEVVIYHDVHHLVKGTKFRRSQSERRCRHSSFKIRFVIKHFLRGITYFKMTFSDINTANAWCSTPPLLFLTSFTHSLFLLFILLSDSKPTAEEWCWATETHSVLYKTTENIIQWINASLFFYKVNNVIISLSLIRWICWFPLKSQESSHRELKTLVVFSLSVLIKWRSVMMENTGSCIRMRDSRRIRWDSFI